MIASSLHRLRPPAVLVVAAMSLIVAGCACEAPPPPGVQQGYAPAQPIAFSHAVHAGQLELDCQYCHTGAEQSRHAGVPAASVCMNCHSQVKTDSPDIQKLAASVESGKPIEWVKIHRLPDHAYFNHANHVTAGLRCQDCHGAVDQMVRVEQAQSMTMGWCVDCHRATEKAGRTAGTLDAAATAIALADGTPLAPPKSPRTLHPPTDCSACHR